MPTITESIASDRRFGVEIEFVGVSQVQAAQALIAGGVSCEVQGYNHRNLANSWKVVNDGSVHHSAGLSGELVSPILSGLDGLATVRNAVNALVAAGATVNRTCGLHVHVNASDFTSDQRMNVVRRYGSFEPSIDSLMAASRHGNNNNYCQSMRSTLGEVHSYATLRGSRYWKVNLLAFDRHQTIEFRQHHGTVNVNKICNWIKFCVNFMEQSVVVPGRDLARASGVVGQRGMRQYHRLVEILSGAPERNPAYHLTPRVRASAIGELMGLRPASVVVMISHLRTRHGFRIHKSWDGYRLLSGTLPALDVTAPVRRPRGRPSFESIRLAQLASAVSVPDSMYRGLDAATVTYFESRGRVSEMVQ